MTTKTFTSGRIKKADYDPASQRLDLHWDNKTVLAYKQVPQEVYRRLCSAPNPATYWEDRIAEEYPKGLPRTPGSGSDGAKNFIDLFRDGAWLVGGSLNNFDQMIRLSAQTWQEILNFAVDPI